MLLCSFDFSGSGVSEGEYVSLGVFETDDTLCVIDYLK
jgi:alpha/beta superfamily hydrolase